MSTEPAPEPAHDPPDAASPGDGAARPDRPASPQREGADRDTPAWEGAEPDDAVGLVDPRREIPNPPGM